MNTKDVIYELRKAAIKSFQCFDQHAAWFAASADLSVLRYAA